ncbi:MAG: energy-coupling factor transporter ATPase [Halanaerobiales bacterium]
MLIKVQDVTHVYEQDHKIKALEDINLSIAGNEFIGLIGHTGSGKSTLVQLFNGLIKPTRGDVVVDGENITREGVKLKHIRQKVGLVFQYPEHQLFEETVYDDVAFGPLNLSLSEAEIENRVQWALAMVGLDFSEFRDRSPFNLSGGQQRKVAIAGVLAMKPQVLILDEPSAGLDPGGREQLINLLTDLHQKQGMTIILISHRMEEIARLSNRVLVLDHGHLVLAGTPAEVFSHRQKMRELDLDLPGITELLYRLKERGLSVKTDIFTISGATREISEELRREDSC